jgi:hypothetical protein
MKSKIKLALAVALIAFCAAALSAEEKFGVKVYEGAKLEKEISEWTSETFSIQAFCYSTNDSVEKVVAFYKKEPGLELMGETKEGAMFKKGDVDITIQNPWQNPKTGQLIKTTLISIVKPQPADQDKR